MGAGGLDAILSPAAKRILDLSIEVKNVEALSVVKTFWDHYNKYANTASLKLLAHKKNRSEMLATLRWSDLLTLLSLAKNDTTTKQ